MNFSYSTGGNQTLLLDAYQKALLDTMAGDQTLFWRQDCLELAWAFFDPVLKAMEDPDSGHGRLHPYRSGSFGPQAALDLLPKGSWPEKTLIPLFSP